jgi:hypothetical protein
MPLAKTGQCAFREVIVASGNNHAVSTSAIGASGNNRAARLSGNTVFAVLLPNLSISMN